MLLGWGTICDSALDGFWTTVERTDTGTGRNGTGPGKTSARFAPNGYRSITVHSRSFLSGKDFKIRKKTGTNSYGPYYRDGQFYPATIVKLYGDGGCQHWTGFCRR